MAARGFSAKTCETRKSEDESTTVRSVNVLFLKQVEVDYSIRFFFNSGEVWHEICCLAQMKVSCIIDTRISRYVSLLMYVS